MAKTKSKKTAKKLPKCPVESDIEINKEDIKRIQEALGPDELYGGRILDAAAKVRVFNKKKYSLEASVVLYVLVDGDFGEDENGKFDNGPHWIKFDIRDMDSIGFWYGSETDNEDEPDWNLEDVEYFKTRIGKDVLTALQYPIEEYIRWAYGN